eukprot:6490854-Amphidinium_carterae.2
MTDAQASLGVICSFGGSSAGELLNVTWKAFLHAGVIKWEIGVIIPDCDAAGDWQTKKLYKVIGNEWSRWERYMNEAGLSLEHVMGKSHESLRRANASPSVLASSCQEHWFSTVGLLCYLSSQASRANMEKRERCRDLLQLFLQRCCSGGVIGTLLEEADESQRSRCSKQVLDGRCLCFQVFLQRCQQHAVLAGDAGKLAEKLVALSVVTSCEALRAHLRHCFECLADAIDQNIHVWGSGGWHQSQAAGLVKVAHRKRKDEHVRQFVASAHAQGRFASHSVAAAAVDHLDSKTAREWVQRELVGYMSHLQTTFCGVGHLSLAFDCSRVGHPAVELLVILVSDGHGLLHGLLPPQVPASAAELTDTSACIPHSVFVVTFGRVFTSIAVELLR